jgi:hypothetical protein
MRASVRRIVDILEMPVFLIVECLPSGPVEHFQGELGNIAKVLRFLRPEKDLSVHRLASFQPPGLNCNDAAFSQMFMVYGGRLIHNEVVHYDNAEKIVKVIFQLSSFGKPNYLASLRAILLQFFLIETFNEFPAIFPDSFNWSFVMKCEVISEALRRFSYLFQSLQDDHPRSIHFAAL